MPIDTISERFWCKVDKNADGGCWLFTGRLGLNGYSVIGGPSQTTVYGHRWSYEQAKGKIPKGLFVMHTCNNRACVNPEHLSLGTPADNSRHMVACERQTRGEKNPMSKLTNEIVLSIRSRVASGETQKSVRVSMGLSKGHVSSIVNRRQWKHV